MESYMIDSQDRKGTPETAAQTQASRVRQILRLQEAILLEEKAKREAAESKITQPASPSLGGPVEQKPHDPNVLFEQDKDGPIPF